MNLLERFQAFARSEHLLDEARPTLLAVSGGLDSMVMAYLFHAAQWPIGIAHCNFQLRGMASDGDEQFVRALAEGWGVPFFSKRFETDEYAAQHGLSTQMAARELRYEWFREVIEENGFNCVATAHHLNDSVETALFNFVRGTGLSGLKGIATKTGRVIRPLLFASRLELEAYAKGQGISWREDASNATEDYARNFLRHRVIPLLGELNPNFLGTAARNLTRLRETDDNLHFLLWRYFFEGKEDGERVFHIDKHKLSLLPSPHLALRALLKKQGFTEEQARQIAENLSHIGLEIQSKTGWRLLNDRNVILLSDSHHPAVESHTIYQDDLMVSVAEGGRMILTTAFDTSNLPDGKEAIVVDAEKLRYPLHLRSWQQGDVFQPFGMGGRSQKLQDLFTNLKLSRFDKEKVLVLENGDGAIVWVVGYRLDERFRVSETTKNLLKIAFVKG